MIEKMIKDKKIAMLATDGFEESELFDSKMLLEDAGAKVEIVSLQKGKIKSWNTILISLFHICQIVSILNHRPHLIFMIP